MPKYKQQKVAIKIPKGYSRAERKAISFDIRQHIVERTKKGFDKNGRRFKGYTEEYMQSADFKASGKTSLVNLSLSDEMLEELKDVKDSDGEIVVGYDGRKNKLNGKVEGNRKGTYGQKKSTGKVRDHLGITKTQLNNILANYPLDDPDRRAEALEIFELARSRARDIGVDVGDE